MTTLLQPSRSIDLDPGLTEFACSYEDCWHRVGHDNDRNWTGTCPACERITRFVRIIE